MKNKNIIARVYEYLIEGYAQTKIAKLLGVTRQRINTITRELLKDGYVRCINPKGNPKFYEATNKPFILKNALRRGRYFRRFERVRVHNISYEFRFVSSPVVPVKWDSGGVWGRGVSQYILKYPFESIGSVTFKRILSKNVDKLIVWLPDEIWMSVDQLPDYEKIILSYCQQCANWFMKRFRCVLEPVGLHQKPHFAILDTLEARVLDGYGNFSVGAHVWVDCSIGVPEWETDVLDYVLIRAEMPEIIYTVMGENMRLKKEVERLRKK